MKYCGDEHYLPAGGSDFWQRLCTRLCSDLMMAARAVEIDFGQHLLKQERVVIAAGSAGRWGPLVDQHLHLGACLPLNLLWSQALTARVLRPSRARERDKTEVFQFSASGTIVDLRPLMFRAAAGRIALAWFLVERRKGLAPPCRSFGDWLHEKGDRISQDDVHAEFLWRVLRASGTWRNAVAQGRGDSRDWEVHMRRWTRGLRYLENQVCIELQPTLSRTPASDPMGAIWWDAPDRSPTDTIEPYLAFDALQYIEHRARSRRDREFEKTFWQLIRVKNLFHQHLTQQEGLAGLTFFDHFYRRMGPFRSALRDSSLSIAEQHLNPAGDVRKLEFRIAPGKDLLETRKDLRVRLRDYAKVLERPGSSARKPACIGLSVHFIKGWGRERDNRPYSYPVQGDNSDRDQRRCRYHSYWRKVWREMEDLTRLLSRAPALSFFVRGIDAANRERSVPNWVLSHLFREFRRRLSPATIGFNPRSYPMRLTAHLGEEFEQPLTGLRHIWEGVRHFGYERGDRIGHGVALGLALEQWGKAHAEVAVPVEEYLDDLVWESLLYEDCGLSDDGDRVRVDAEIDVLARALYPDHQIEDHCPWHPLTSSPNASTLREAYRHRFDSDVLLSLGVLACDPQNGDLKIPRRMAPSDMSTGSLGLVSTQLFCERLWQRAHGIGNWRVQIDDWYLRRVERIQTCLRQWVGVRGIVVETCPSSNRLIGDLGWYDNHPVFQFAPPASPGVAHVSFTVNSDDPLTFNTRITDEFDHLFLAMTERLNVPASQAERWIRDRCEMAWNTSFVVGAADGATQDCDVDNLHRAIRKAYGQLSPYA